MKAYIVLKKYTNFSRTFWPFFVIQKGPASFFTKKMSKNAHVGNLKKSTTKFPLHHIGMGENSKKKSKLFSDSQFWTFFLSNFQNREKKFFQKTPHLKSLVTTVILSFLYFTGYGLIFKNCIFTVFFLSNKKNTTTYFCFY